MVEVAFGLAGALAALGIFSGVSGVLRRIRTLELRPTTKVPQPYDDAWVHGALADLTARVQDQTLAIEEGIERVGRAEQRVKETVRRAKARATAAGYEDPGIEAEIAELQRRDGEGGEEQRLRLLHDGVGEAESSPSSIHGVTIEQLHRARGF